MYTFFVKAINGSLAERYTVAPGTILEIREYIDGVGVRLHGDASETRLAFASANEQQAQVFGYLKRLQELADNFSRSQGFQVMPTPEDKDPAAVDEQPKLEEAPNGQEAPGV